KWPSASSPLGLTKWVSASPSSSWLEATAFIQPTNWSRDSPMVSASCSAASLPLGSNKPYSSVLTLSRCPGDSPMMEEPSAAAMAKPSTLTRTTVSSDWTCSSVTMAVAILVVLAGASRACGAWPYSSNPLASSTTATSGALTLGGASGVTRRKPPTSGGTAWSPSSSEETIQGGGPLGATSWAAIQASPGCRLTASPG